MRSPEKIVTGPGPDGAPITVRLRYSLNAEILFEELRGKHPRDVDWGKPEKKDARALLFAELEGYRLKHDPASPPFTEGQAGDLWTDLDGALGPLYDAMLEAMLGGTARKVPGAPEPPAAAGGTPEVPKAAPPAGPSS